MQRLLKNRTNSMDAVTRFCLENPLIVDLLPALGLTVPALQVEVQSILSLAILQEANEKGVAMTKKELKQAMLNLGFGVASAGQAMFRKQGNTTLYEKLRFPVSTLMHGKSFTAIDKAMGVYDILNAINKTVREPFGLTDAVLSNYLDSITAFKNQDKSTVDVRADKKAQTALLKTMVKEGMVIMRDEVVKTAEQLVDTQPLFVMGLRDRAKVVNPSTETKQRFEIFDDVTEKAIANATIKVLQTGESAVTNTKGTCSIYLPFGDYTFEISKAEHITMTVDAKVKKGSNTMHVELAPKFILPAETVVEKEKVTVEK